MTVLFGILLAVLIWENVSGSARAVFHSPVTDRFSNAFSEFVSRFSRWFPRISQRYVLTAGLLEFLFTFVVASFLYREFLKVETEPLFDRSENRPERFQLLMLVGVTLAILVPLFVGWTGVSLFIEVANEGSMKHKVPARDVRSMTFMLLFVLNPMMYQLAVGLSMAMFVKRYLGILIPMLTVGLLIYAIMLTTCFCLFDNGPFDSMVFWSTAKERSLRGDPPEVALWITGLFGVACLWLTLWPARKLLVRRDRGATASNTENAAPARDNHPTDT